MLANLGDAQGSLPYIRIGGSSQDDTNYNASQTAIVVTNPTTAPFLYTIRPAYFQHYATAKTKISQGFNLASLLKTEATADQSSLVSWAKDACASLGPVINVLEMGNEPDSYVTQGRAVSTFTAADYATKWKAAALSITNACPAFKTAGFMSPSLANPLVGDWITDAFTAGLNSNNNIQQVSIHS